MTWDQINIKLIIKRTLMAIVAILIAALVRYLFLGSLGGKITWLTFYPAITIVAFYGGVFSGIIATLLSCLLVIYGWNIFTISPFIKDGSDWLGLIFFVFNCILISLIAELAHTSKIKANKAKEQAEAANQAKSAFLADMSHELRTPLSTILGYSQLMQRDSTISSEQKGYLNTINQSGEHLLSLINDVLEISKIEAKRIVLAPANFNFHVLIRDLKIMFQLRTDAKDLDFEVTGLEKIPEYIIADETKIRILFINLLSNAIKFTDKGGIYLRFSLSRENENLYLHAEIEDTGTGIAEEEMNKLFTYFVQTESGKKSQSGTGLGLAICKDYARLMGGNISATSTLNKGSVFSFKILIHEGQEEGFVSEPEMQIVTALQPGQKIPRVLIAEDIEINRNLLVKLLSSVGFNVKEAVNGVDAVKTFKQWQPDFIWMDIRMPIMDGLEATRIIKAVESGKSTKIVALSAHVLDEKKKEIFEAGCDDFVGKPYRENEIFETMKKHLGIKYVYKEDENAKNVQNETISEIDNQQFKALPVEVIKELHEAILTLNTENILIKINQIIAINKPLGLALKKTAEKLDYSSLLKLLEGK